MFTEALLTRAEAREGYQIDGRIGKLHHRGGVKRLRPRGAAGGARRQMITRRTFLRATASALALACGPRQGLAGSRQRPLPSPSQLAWQRDELAMFLHFGVNTFTNREWGDGREDPTIFAPSRLDARQWARTARAAG